MGLSNLSVLSYGLLLLLHFFYELAHLIFVGITQVNIESVCYGGSI